MNIIDQQPYLVLGITRTRFTTVKVAGNLASKGVPLGQGSCKGVELIYSLASIDETDTDTNFLADLYRSAIFYGDSQQQSYPLFVGIGGTGITFSPVSSGFIPCTDLDQVWVRWFVDPNGFGGAVPFVNIEVKIYD